MYSPQYIAELEQRALAKYEDNGHSLLSPSGYSRWAYCLGSVARLHEDRASNADVIASVEGTIAHLFLEIALRMGVLVSELHKYRNMIQEGYGQELTALVYRVMSNPANGEEVLGYISARQEDMLIPVIPDSPMCRYLDILVNTIRAYQNAGYALYPEVHVSLKPHLGHSQCDGTSDVVLWNPVKKHLIVLDLKYGINIPVYPRRKDGSLNGQMALYGYGAMSTLGIDPQRITFVISQGRISDRHWDATEVTLKELTDFIPFTKQQSIKALEIIARGVASEEDYAPSESACKWCARRGKCRFQLNKALDDARMAFGVCPSTGEVSPVRDEITNAELKQFLLHAPFISSAIDRATEIMEGRVREGHKDLGFKLVTGRKSRSIVGKKDEDKLARLRAIGVPEELAYARKLKSPNQLLSTKELADLHPEIEKLIVVAEGKPRVVVDTSQAKAIDDNPF